MNERQSLRCQVGQRWDTHPSFVIGIIRASAEETCRPGHTEGRNDDQRLKKGVFSSVIHVEAKGLQSNENEMDCQGSRLLSIYGMPSSIVILENP